MATKDTVIGIKVEADTAKAKADFDALGAAIERANAGRAPGWKTSEFWLSTAPFLLTALLESGALPDASPAVRIVSWVVSTLAALGYTASRTFLKK